MIILPDMPNLQPCAPARWDLVCPQVLILRGLKISLYSYCTEMKHPSLGAMVSPRKCERRGVQVFSEMFWFMVITWFTHKWLHTSCHLHRINPKKIAADNLVLTLFGCHSLQLWCTTRWMETVIIHLDYMLVIPPSTPWVYCISEKRWMRSLELHKSKI